MKELIYIYIIHIIFIYILYILHVQMLLFAFIFFFLALSLSFHSLIKSSICFVMRLSFLSLTCLLSSACSLQHQRADFKARNSCLVRCIASQLQPPSLPHPSTAAIAVGGCLTGMHACTYMACALRCMFSGCISNPENQKCSAYKGSMINNTHTLWATAVLVLVFPVRNFKGRLRQHFASFICFLFVDVFSVAWNKRGMAANVTALSCL